ncbi:DUF2267 domain-containing protein [Kitasatospora sp. NPDC093679]|uniref:DUF2267 domain-containing protein n=1 Tax=Kitasatospora sp. NPDC093679 TaxID=3154983 RepID=UPI00341A3501
MTRHRLLLQQVRTLGRYSDDEEAGRVLDTVLTLLGSQLTGEERCDLAAVLPEQDRAVLVSQVPLPEPVTAPAFVEAVARALHTSLACARWDTSSVLAALADHAGDELIDRLLVRLPSGYALLFGRADLAVAA